MPHRFGILACVYSADPDRSRYPGQTVTFTLTPADGYTLTGADYPGARLTRTGTGYTLSLPEVRYSTAVAVTAEKVIPYSTTGTIWAVTGSRLLLPQAICV